MKTFFLVLCIPLISSFAPVPEILCRGFLPNSVPVRNQQNGPVTEKEFNDVIAKLVRIYQPEFEALGEKLVLVGSWDYDDVNAVAYRIGKEDWIQVYGGLARQPSLTRDGLALVLCHEIGHYLGGFPIYNDEGKLSFEGEADYFSTLKCARKFFADEDNAKAIADQKIEPLVKETCEKQFARNTDRLLCLRSSLAAFSMASVANDNSDDGGIDLKFSTPDTSRLGYTERSYPGVQCRLDTMFAGLSCAVDPALSRSKDDYRIGACFVPQDRTGYRPYCWFEPEEWN